MSFILFSTSSQAHESSEGSSDYTRYIRDGYKTVANELNKTNIYVSFAMISAVLLIPTNIRELEINLYIWWGGIIWFTYAGMYFGFFDRITDVRKWKRAFNESQSANTNLDESNNPKERFFHWMLISQAVFIVLTILIFAYEITGIINTDKADRQNQFVPPSESAFDSQNRSSSELEKFSEESERSSNHPNFQKQLSATTKKNSPENKMRDKETVKEPSTIRVVEPPERRSFNIPLKKPVESPPLMDRPPSDDSTSDPQPSPNSEPSKPDQQGES